MVTQSITTSSVAESARRRIARRLLPYLFFLYVIAYLDRVNLSYASLEMSGALGFTAHLQRGIAEVDAVKVGNDIEEEEIGKQPARNAPARTLSNRRCSYALSHH